MRVKGKHLWYIIYVCFVVSIFIVDDIGYKLVIGVACGFIMIIPIAEVISDNWNREIKL